MYTVSACVAKRVFVTMPTPAMAAMMTPTKPNTVNSLACVFRFSNHRKKLSFMGPSCFSLQYDRPTSLKSGIDDPRLILCPQSGKERPTFPERHGAGPRASPRLTQRDSPHLLCRPELARIDLSTECEFLEPYPPRHQLASCRA